MAYNGEIDFEELLKLNGTQGAAARMQHVRRIIERAKFASQMSHHVAIELIEEAVSKFDDSFSAHLVAVRDFFGEFWGEMEKRAQQVAFESERDAEPSDAAARAFTLLDPGTKVLVASLRDQNKTRTIPEMLVKLGELKRRFDEHPHMVKLWRETLRKRFGQR